MCDQAKQIAELRQELAALKVALAKCFSMFDRAGVIGYRWTDEMGYLVGCHRDDETEEWHAD